MAGDTLTWLDGEPGEALPLPDRGLDFGDGLFETLLLRNGTPLYIDLHLARLGRGCQVLGLPEPEATVRDQLQRAAHHIEARGWRWSALRITLTRGGGPRGYAPPQAPAPRLLMTATRLQSSPLEMSGPARLGLARVRWPLQPLLAGLKHLNRLEQVLAARDYRRDGFDEALMLDQAGAVISVVAGNLFAVRGGRLHTAALECSGIAGTRRELILRDWAPALGIEVEIGSLSSEQVEAADELFYSNSLIGLRPVAQLGQRRWESHPVCEALFRHYRGEVA